MIGLRGKIVPIVDLPARLTSKILILDVDDGQLGVRVDDVDEVITITAEQLEAVPTANSSIEAGSPSSRTGS